MNAARLLFCRREHRRQRPVLRRRRSRRLVDEQAVRRLLVARRRPGPPGPPSGRCPGRSRRVGHVVARELVALHLEQVLGVAQWSSRSSGIAVPGGRCRGRRSPTPAGSGRSRPTRRVHRAVVGVDGRLDCVAHVVDLVGGQRRARGVLAASRRSSSRNDSRSEPTDTGRSWCSRRGSTGSGRPDRRVGVTVDGQPRRDLLHALAGSRLYSTCCSVHPLGQQEVRVANFTAYISWLKNPPTGTPPLPVYVVVASCASRRAGRDDDVRRRRAAWRSTHLSPADVRREVRRAELPALRAGSTRTARCSTTATRGTGCEKVAPWLTVDERPLPGGGRRPDRVDPRRLHHHRPLPAGAERESFETMTDDSLTQDRPVRTLPTDEINYMRNAVKATVDAYDGTVTLYAWDETDPILKAWRSAFPGTVQDRRRDPRLAAGAPALPRGPVQGAALPVRALPRDRRRDFYQGNNRWEVPEDPNAQGSYSRRTGSSSTSRRTTGGDRARSR